MAGLVQTEVDQQALRLQSYHRRRLISTFRRALAVDIRPVLREEPIRLLMNGWRRENIDLIQTIPERLKAGLRTKMTRAFREAPFDQARLQRIVAQQGKVGGYDLRRITRDQTSKAIGQLTRARHQQIGITEYTWQTSRDGRVRDSHAILEGTRQTYDNPPSVGNPGQDIQCFPGSVRVLPLGLKGSVAYRYVGKLIEITLAEGVEIATTPNHPILTESGWKRAGLIDESDNLLVHRGLRALATRAPNPHFGEGYPLAHELHGLSSGLENLGRTHGRRIDLHGDPAGRDEEVDAVNIERELRNDLDASCRQLFANLNLELPDMRVIGAILPAYGSSPLSVPVSAGIACFRIGGTAKSLLVRKRHLRHAQRVGLAAIARLKSQFVNAEIDGGAWNVQFAGHPQRGLASFVAFSNGWIKSLAPSLVGHIERGVFNPKVAETRNNDLIPDAKRAGDVPIVSTSLHESLDFGEEWFAAFARTRPRFIRSRHYDGPVYSVETDSGIIIANGIVTHNCRCVGSANHPRYVRH